MRKFVIFLLLGTSLLLTPFSQINYAFAASPSDIVALDAETDGVNGFTELENAQDVETFTIGANTYAIVASFANDSLQIIDISDPTNIVAVDAETDGVNGFTVIDAPNDIDIFTIGANTYAIVASYNDHGVQIIDISDPTNIVAKDAETDGVNGFSELLGIMAVDTFTIGANTYAIAVSANDAGVQIIDISDPTDISATDAETDGVNGFTLNAGTDVETFTIGANTYAIVTLDINHGIQIIDISDPTNIIAVDAETDGANGFTELRTPEGVDIFTIGANTYAIVVARVDDGVQIIDISDPTNIVAKDAETDGANGFTALDYPSDVSTFTIGANTYAIVTSFSDDGIQIIDISDPTNIIAVDAETDGANGFTELLGAYGVSTFTIGANTYAIVTSESDNGIQMIQLDGSSSSLSSSSDDSNGSNREHLTRPTFGISHETFLPIVTEGFSFNEMTFDITDNWHTDFPKQSVKIGTENSFSTKVYTPYDVRVQEFLFGIKDIGDAHNAELGVEVYYDSLGNVDGAKIIQETNVVDEDSFSGITFPSKCTPDDTEEKCITTSITLRFLEPLQHDVMAIKAIDWRNRVHITYLNEGFDISGDSLNPMKSQMVTGTAKYEGLIKVTQNEKYSKYWTSDDGRIFERNDSGTFSWKNQSFERFVDSGFPTHRSHSEFSILVDYETKRAEYVVKSICGECLDESFDKIDDVTLSPNSQLDRTIDFEEMKSQELVAQEKLRDILNLDYLEYTRGYGIQNWE